MSVIPIFEILRILCASRCGYCRCSGFLPFELSIALKAVEEAKQQEDKETSKLAQANAAAEVAKKTEEEERESILIAYATLTPHSSSRHAVLQ